MTEALGQARQGSSWESGGHIGPRWTLLPQGMNQRLLPSLVNSVSPTKSLKSSWIALAHSRFVPNSLDVGEAGELGTGIRRLDFRARSYCSVLKADERITGVCVGFSGGPYKNGLREC